MIAFTTFTALHDAKVLPMVWSQLMDLWRLGLGREMVADTHPVTLGERSEPSALCVS